MEILILIGAILVILGIAGSILPALPGPVIGFVGLVLLFFSESVFIPVSSLVWFGVGMILLTLIDFLAPILGARYLGSSRKGLVGALIGALLGIIFFPPLGIFLGSFIGAVVGETASGKKGSEAIRAGIGTLMGSVIVIALQTVYSISLAIYFFIKIF